MSDLQNPPVVLIIGAGEPAGRALARAFAGAGFRVAANDRTPIRLDQTVEQVEEAGGEVRGYVRETNKGLPAHELVDEVLADWDRIDVLVNALNVCPPATLLKLDEWDWQHTLEVNLSGPFLLMQAVGKIMREQGGGIIVNLVDPFADSGDSPAYAATQAARAALSEAASRELLAYNIRIFTIQSGINADSIPDLQQWAEQVLLLVTGSAETPDELQS